MSCMAVPLGTLLPWLGDLERHPSGYLPCDGRPFAKNQYPELFGLLSVLDQGSLIVDANSCRTPDLRGQFLRGLDAKSDGHTPVDHERVLAGAGLLSAQSDALANHGHEIMGAGRYTVAAIGWSYQGDPGGLPPVLMSHPGDRDGRALQAVGAGGSETRPSNVAVHYLIRAVIDGSETAE